MRTIKAKAVIVLFVVPLSVVAVQNWGYRGAIFALVSASGISLVVNMFYFSSALRSKKF
jgi:Na+-driven multidrug efflux pump